MSPPFSVLMVTHAGEKAEHLQAALKSLAEQSLPADEILLVCAGPLPPEQNEVVARAGDRLPLVRLDLERNEPLGVSLNIGLKRTRHAWVARMDSDDIAVPDRFQRQFDMLANHPELDVLGSAIDEFHTDPDMPVSRRGVPLKHDRIAALAFQRTPFNHMTVVYRKSAVLAAGNYRDMRGFEDFDLWTRMLVNGARMANLGRVLVHARIGNGFHRRRGGLRYAIHEWRALGAANSINPGNRLKINLQRPARFAIRILPSSWRSAIYKGMRRK